MRRGAADHAFASDAAHILSDRPYEVPAATGGDVVRESACFEAQRVGLNDPSLCMRTAVESSKPVTVWISSIDPSARDISEACSGVLNSGEDREREGRTAASAEGSHGGWVVPVIDVWCARCERVPDEIRDSIGAASTLLTKGRGDE
jgi:hypothetical protein